VVNVLEQLVPALVATVAMELIFKLALLLWAVLAKQVQELLAALVVVQELLVMVETHLVPLVVTVA
jgi:hypothetical protein